jgi:HEPN domain-containing protein
MSSEKVVANSLRLAKGNLDAARLLAKNSNRNASYHCEQAAEMIIRAVLTSESQHGGHKHQLETMVDLVPDANSLKPMLRAIEHLATYATTYRYPTTAGRIQPSPTAQVLATDIALVEAALNEAVARFEVDLSNPDLPAGNARPIR